MLLVALKLLLPGHLAEFGQRIGIALETNVDAQAVFSVVGHAAAGEWDPGEIWENVYQAVFAEENDVEVMKTAVITDGRFSGGTRGICVGHICPEAADGGVISLIENGDIIEININNKTLNLKVSEEELAKRKQNFVRPELKVKSGYLAKYSKIVQDASHGAIVG